MGQTLTHGVYLPDEGERNCYAGLAANWQILDTSVGTIAAHTAALAGKAPLVHTHTVSQITDFPAYGNAAGTICEGNDSRLSDARTPVAHTHTKSDVTDLLNSNFIPSANNSYDLGSSSYQWNNLYAKNYYYNGVAWGLDKSNVWSAINSYSAGIKLQGSRTAYVLPEFSAGYSGLSLLTYSASGAVKIGVFTESNNTPVLDTTKGYLSVTIGEVNSANIVRLEPVHGDTANLGTSTNKWKSFNGINPGALSLPDLSNVVSVDTTNWSLTGARNSYTPSANGWFFIRVEGTGVCKLNIHLGSTDNNYPTWSNWNTDTYTVLTVPAIQGVKLYVYVTADLIKYCRFYPCLGNV